jgi:sugar fermentation stimulation protein A
MRFNNKLIPGVLIKRYKRFLADVRLGDGEVVVAHCPNTGAMSGCAEPGMEVWLSPSDNPKRKLAYTWELGVTADGHWLGVNTHNANKIVAAGLNQDLIIELRGYQQVRPEVIFGQEKSRIDFLLQDKGKADCYVEVKSVTLLQDGLGFFPDAKTLRGQKHLRELAAMATQGNRAVLFYCVQHTGIKNVQVAAHIDPQYDQELRRAKKAGVEVVCYSCVLTEQKITINQRLQLID